MVLVEPDLALIEFGHPRFDGVELGLSRLSAHRRLNDRLGEPLRLTVNGFQPGTHGVDLAGEPGQALPTVRLGRDGSHVLTLCLGDRGFPGR
ncbi:Uncharacterised protein [Mycobacteroides abscessus subsp. bolletii]|nr:Uncharacterised protein [Mycobacteroides abscessus subsp. bolletii]SLK62126.1 Uncharacterised protein [Mycobacteroides abscessus subsp. bolletii]